MVNWIQGYLDPSEQSNVLYGRAWSLVQHVCPQNGPVGHPNARTACEVGNERIGATSIAFPGIGDDAVIRACRERLSG